MRLLLFDIDGTLLRLRGGTGRRVFVDAFHHCLNVDVSKALQDMSFAGRTDRNLVVEIAQRVGIDSSESESAWPEIKGVMEDRSNEWIVADAVEVMPGADRLLSFFSSHNYTLGLVTGNIRSVAFCKLRAAGLESYFNEGAFGCEHPDRNELPSRAVARLNAFHGTTYSHDATVIIGDAPQDIECARVNGIRSIGVATGQHSIRELSECGADAVLESFREVQHSADTILG